VAVSGRAPGYDEIAALAYAYWLERGCPTGSPEVDWLRAERELAARGDDSPLAR
jgi:hypothetical protein